MEPILITIMSDAAGGSSSSSSEGYLPWLFIVLTALGCVMLYGTVRLNWFERFSDWLDRRKKK